LLEVSDMAREGQDDALQLGRIVWKMSRNHRFLLFDYPVFV
jgi:hypothetical protein